ncbi:hypothetical protein NQ176_g10321 [Zarea fungicola]|uniref:Uncharacterized protein n=1 Tax=Zarea fungicola TaxID=93591 RepID=A0ACC1MI98_9HYPO|nr:hypothetical protein NQ176_g10321 [Lecanicillium fungicola]
MPSHLLTTVLSDLEFRGRVASHSETHSAVASESSSVIQRPALPLPQGHHLVYFPIQTAPSDLAPDGADLDHSPGPHYCRRLWAGGEVTFRSTSDQDGLVLNGQPWTCTETIDDVRVKGSGVPDGTEKVFVDVWRRYALGHASRNENLPCTRALENFISQDDKIYSGQLVSHFVYRNHAPLYVNEPLTVKLRMVPQRRDGVVRAPIWDAWVEGPDGGLAVKGTATMSS